jgi:isopentenyl-diphosphate delta-isomerase
MLDHKIVSSDSEELILVDERDNELGFLSKQQCHDGDGVLHRAFSLFVFNAMGELLLQKRSADKRLWPLFWSNSCCSHPRKGESMEVATRRRLQEELDIHAELEFVYKFSYRAQFGEQGAENELCSVFLGRTDQTYSANANEIAEARFVSIDALSNELQTNPEEFTPWFKMEWERLSGEFAVTLAAYSKYNNQPT